VNYETEELMQSLQLRDIVALAEYLLEEDASTDVHIETHWMSVAEANRKKTSRSKQLT
jgi:hypothetical protein